MGGLVARPVRKYLHSFSELREVFLRAFPAKERTPMWHLLCTSKKEGCEFLAMHDGMSLVGLTYLVFLGDLTYIHYLAVHHNKRSEGYGSAILDYVKKRTPRSRLVLLMEAVEENADNYAQRVRRKAFYANNGFLPNGLTVYISGFALTCLTYDCKVSAEELKGALSKVLPDAKKRLEFRSII